MNLDTDQAYPIECRVLGLIPRESIGAERARSPMPDRISDPVMTLLDSIVIEGCTVLPLPMADRPVYEELDAVLTRLRG